MEIRMQKIVWPCACKTLATKVQLRVGSDGILYAFWICSFCKTEKYAILSIGDLIEMIPTSPAVMNDDDAKYLKEMHISLEST